MPLRREVIQVDEILGRAASLYREVAEAKEVQLHVDETALAVVGDRVRLEQVVANLIDNAIKYTAAGGRVDGGVER